MSYYAEFCPYGITTLSDEDDLMQFATKRERDDMVDQINECEGFDRCRPVTTREISHRYDLRDFRDGDKYYECQGIRTCAHRIVFAIRQRPNYTI